jgi:hypothetical protein
MARVAAPMKTLLVTLAMVLFCSGLMADGRHHAASGAPGTVKGPSPFTVQWLAFPFSDAASAAALFSAHAADAMPPVMISTDDATVDRFIVFLEVKGDAFYPPSGVTYSQSLTGPEAMQRLDASTARLKGVSSMPDGSVLVWELQ